MRYPQQDTQLMTSRNAPRKSDENVATDRGEEDARAAAVLSQFGSRANAAAYANLYDGSGPSARYFHSRLHAVLEALHACPGGELLDVGCGPGLLIRRIASERPGDFRFTACDWSQGMLAEAVAANRGVNVTPIVGRAEKLPMATGSFDAVLATGLLEYTDRPVALREISRVVRPGGQVILTMLNPLSPYRLFEWTLYWPFLRRLGNVEALFGISARKRHGAVVSGIQATPAFRLAREMRSAGLQPHDIIYYDLNAFVPPIDQWVRRSDRRWRDHPERTVSRGVGRLLGTGYLIAAQAGERASVASASGHRASVLARTRLPEPRLSREGQTVQGP